MLMIGTKNADQVIRSTEGFFEKNLRSRADFPKDRGGGYLCVADRTDGMPILIAQIGFPHPENAPKYLRFAQEKAKRLARAVEKKGHVSSWQSRDEVKKKYGGAIVAGQLIFSFSGFPEKADEALMLWVAQACDVTGDGKENPAQIAALSENHFFSFVNEVEQT